MTVGRNPEIADIDDDPNVEIRPYSSPPCYAHEVDPAYFGLATDATPATPKALDAALNRIRAAIRTVSGLLTRI